MEQTLGFGASKIFGSDSNSKEWRIAKYNYLEKFIFDRHENWDSAPDTNRILKEFESKISEMSKQELAFLLCHTGYIPEQYDPDSSQETLYSKLVEATVKAWAIEIGFTKSDLPTQKASKEDITISDGKNVIVADAKSFRLGRSQRAPNVKDALKHSDIEKWLAEYKELDQIGGLVTLPSQHDWKTGSDFYQYTSDKTSPTLCLNYQHMAFMLIRNMRSKNLIDLLKAYPDLFPAKLTKKEKNRSKYYSAIESALFKDVLSEWSDFKKLSQKIIDEFTFHTIETLQSSLCLIKSKIQQDAETIKDIDVLRDQYVKSEFTQLSSNHSRQLENIKKFRKFSESYYE